MKVPNMNHGFADARPVFPALLSEPLGLERGGVLQGRTLDMT